MNQIKAVYISTCPTVTGVLRSEDCELNTCPVLCLVKGQMVIVKICHIFVCCVCQLDLILKQEG